jgi:hypothetical protein
VRLGGERLISTASTVEIQVHELLEAGKASLLKVYIQLAAC